MKVTLIMPKFGIDVSSFNGDINFTMIKDQIDFVLIRCGYGNDVTSQDDSKYERNVRECEALGIPYGVYFYSYALNMEDTESEIQHCLRLVRKANPTYGVWLDMEDGDGYKASHGFPSKEMLVSICERFLMGIESAGPGRRSDEDCGKWGQFSGRCLCGSTGNLAALL